LFTRQICVNCHTVESGEAPRGPHLGDVALRYSPDELAASILDPNATIAQGFETQWFRLNDGEELQGFAVRESGDAVTIRNAVGEERLILKSDLAARGRSEISTMPEGLTANLTVRDLASMLAYLTQLAKQTSDAAIE
jgi:putative heme-binding domain-containing protein